ncbi:MAG: ROK family transcriptional regulator [Bacilli bacterium]|nr:ROK family transcriptional regulator [Bacilli bacterium]
MQTYENQYNLRVANELKVLTALKSGPKSLNDLAEKLGVSFTAVSKIIDQMVESNLVKRVNKKVKTLKRGRIPTFVKLDTSVGVTAAIDLSTSSLKVAVSDLTGKIIVYDEVSAGDVVTEEKFVQISEVLKELLKRPEVENRRLLGICISSPGMVNKYNGEYGVVFKIKTHNNLSPINYFFNEFGVPVNLYNDVKLGMIAEKMYGVVPLDAKDYMFIHIGNGCGVSFSFNGKLYQGKNGFCGELTNLIPSAHCEKNYLYGFVHFMTKIEELDPSLNVRLPNGTPNKEKIAELYNADNEVVVKAIDYYLEKNAQQVIAYNDLLDFEYIIFEGGINLFGEKARTKFLNYIATLDTVEFRAKILFSNFKETPSSLLGAIYQANNIYYLNRLEEITNQRSSAGGHYDISEAFGNNI